MIKTIKNVKGFSEEEKLAMRERSQELDGKSGGESAVLVKISAMTEPDRTLAKRLHEIIKATAPSLLPKTWYGMPAYANKAGQVVCFFQDAAKFKSRYAILGFSDKANLDEGEMWPTSFALKKLTSVEEAKIITLIKRAIE